MANSVGRPKGINNIKVNTTINKELVSDIKEYCSRNSMTVSGFIAMASKKLLRKENEK